MLTGIDDIDWTGLQHAYGDASDVPEMLRGLLSADADEREGALDALYGTVHHQGDVHDSTVACLPFLFEIATTPGPEGRGEVVELLRSIHGDGRDPEVMDFWSDDEEEYEEWCRLLDRAEADVRDRAGSLLPLLADPDPGVRRAVPGALVQLLPDPEGVRAALTGRLAAEAEEDPTVLRAVAAALGDLGVRHARLAGATADALAPLLDRPGGGLPLAALTALARCAPDRLPEPAVTARLAAAELRTAREGAPETERAPARSTDSTLIGYLRRLRAEHTAGTRAPWATDLLGELHFALGDRVEARFALVADQLGSPERGQRREAVNAAGTLLSGWRGPHEEPVRLLGELVLHADPVLAREAAAELCRLAVIGAPAAEALAARVARGPGLPPQARWHETSYGAALCALAAQGDPRAVPGLAEVLRYGHVPEELPEWLARMAPETAARLAPALTARLAATVGAGRSSFAAQLLGAAAVAAPEAAVTAAAGCLNLEGKARLRSREAALRTLAGLGAAAEPALPALRGLVGEADGAALAAALWAAGGDAEARRALAALEAGLGAGSSGGAGAERHDALRALACAGTAAAPLLPALRGLAARPDEVDAWHAGALAEALWRVGGDPGETLAASLHAWERSRSSRPDMTEIWAALGPAAAPVLPLLRAESAAPRRHDNEGGRRGRMRFRVAEDERLLRHARTVLAACGAPYPGPGLRPSSSGRRPDR
ncbi:PBS lyase [Streptomyces sp. R302]|uniref:PBS lyase n=1 Tax=unclassified Streptomyces TaxID=2593676 RepID=UPI00145F8C09|nr:MULTISPECIES: PBS lyase [unclassified Streptomyces]NML51878.1 PBS lyase [Streptomyces sp. R301]NML81498.1 PBS lyase [Streptomyces sp. R302]